MRTSELSGLCAGAAFVVWQRLGSQYPTSPNLPVDYFIVYPLCFNEDCREENDE